MIEPEFDADGYPTETTLKLIENWPHTNFVELIEFVKKAWRYPHYFMMDEQDENLLCVSTGGWSGNESLIGAMKANVVFWA